MLSDHGNTIKRPRAVHSYRIGFGMAFLSSEGQQICAFTKCRDRLHDYLKTSYHGQREDEDQHWFWPDRGDPFPYTDKLKLLFLLDFPELSISVFEHALNNWNKIEQFAGIEKTTGELVRYDKERFSNNGKIVLLTGSDEYTKIPQLLSALTLFIRFICFNPKFAISNLENLTKDVKRISEGNTCLVKDGYYMMAAAWLVPHILKNRVELFGDLGEKGLFPTGMASKYHTNSGIVSLCNEASLIVELNLRMRSLKKML